METTILALTRAQLVSGDSSQGVVLPGQVQGVKEGTGIDIAADGTISVDEGDLTTFVRLNSGAAYNGYVWPGTSGAASTFLMTDATGNLTWQRVRIPVNTVTPTTPTVGEMWFDCATGQFKVYESCTTGTAQWTSVSQPGLPVLPANTSANPAFTGGSGTSGAPYQCTVTTIPAGSNIFIVNEVTIVGLAPNQYVPIVDLNAVTNGGRYSFTNNYANSSGTLIFQTVFKDQPASAAGTTYTANIKVGYGTVYISAQVGIVSVLSISNPGTISGTPEIGQTLTYTTGTATGGSGAGTYTYTWQWIKDSDNSVLQTGGATYLVPPALAGDKVFVRLTATDTIPQSASANTDLFPASGVITKGAFPNPTPPAFPSDIGVDSCLTWDGPGTTLQSDGCLEFNVNGGAFNQSSKIVATNDVVCTRWADVPSSGLCGDAPNGTTINGCVFDANHEACGSLTIDRVPSTFPPFATVIDHVASTVATSNGSTPYGYNATSYVTGSLSAGASTLEGSLDGGATWAAIPASGETFGINPGETLIVRYTTGASSNTTYVATVNLGQSPNFTTQTFTVVNDAVPFPSTSINFPALIPDVAATTWNEAGTTPLTATGCLEMATAPAGPFSQSLSISFGNTLYTQWISSAACGDKASGPIAGCIKGGAYEECYTLNVNRVPTNFPPIAAVTGVLPSAYATSAAVTPSGTTAPSYLTTSTVAGVSNVEASIDGGTSWVTVPTSGTTFTVPPYTSVQFRYQGATAGTTYTVPFKLGDGVSSVTQNFVVTTGKPAFPNTNVSFPAFIPQVTTTTWNEPGSTVLTPSGCIQISLNGSTWTNATETIANGATLYTRYNPSVACGGATSGPISGCVSSATGEECGTLTLNRTPSNFPPITAVTGVTPGAYGTSAAVNPSGFTAPSYVTVASVPAGVTNIEASADGGTTWFGVGTATAASAVVNPDQNLAFRFKGANPTTTYSVNFRLGDGTNYVQQIYSVTTGTTSIPTADWNPSPSTGPNASPDTVNTGTLKGTASGTWNGTVPQTLTTTGGLQINLNGGAWGTSVNATASGTDVVAFRWDPTAVASANNGDILTGTVSNGTNINTYSFTVSKLVTAGSLAFVDLLNQSTTTTVTSAGVTPTGFNVPLSATFAGTASNGLTTPLLSAGGLGFAASPVTVNPGDQLLLRGTTGSGTATAYGITINLGGQSDTWTATTSSVTPTVSTPSINNPSSATPIDPTANVPSGITVTTPASGVAGGFQTNYSGTQTAADWYIYKAIPTNPTSSAITNVSSTNYTSTLSSSSGFVPDNTNVGGVNGGGPAFAFSNTSTPVLASNAAASLNFNSTFTWTPSSSISSDSVVIYHNSTGTGAPISTTQGSSATAPTGLPSATALAGLIPNQILGPGNSLTIGVNNPGGETVLLWGISVNGVFLVNSQTQLTLTDATDLASMQVGDSVVEVGGGADGTGTITAINSATAPYTLTLYPTTGTWNTTATAKDTTRTIIPPAPPALPPTVPDNTKYTAVTGFPLNKTSAFNSAFIAQANLSTSSKYYASVIYTGSGSVVSTASAWKDFTTVSSFSPPPAGSAYAGGYFAGQINDGGTIYNLIVAPIGPVTQGANTLYGQYGGSPPTQIQWSTVSGGTGPSAQSETYGGIATVTNSGATFPMFNWCIHDSSGPNAGTYDATNATGTGIGGYNDWYIPAKNELEVCYYFLKPDTTPNQTTFGSNANAVSPEPVSTNYSAGSPAQTTASIFQSGGSQAFQAVGVPSFTATYYSATEDSAPGQDIYAWRQFFIDGSQYAFNIDKTLPRWARSIRRTQA